MAYEIGYPVDFRSGGDTVKEAFSKHINEIKRIYSYLNALDSDKASASVVTSMSNELNTHKQNTNPHPNMTKASYNFSEINGELDCSRLTGSLSASKVSGVLSNATVSYASVTGLDSHITQTVSATIDAASIPYDSNTSVKDEFVMLIRLVVDIREELEAVGRRVSALEAE